MEGYREGIKSEERNGLKEKIALMKRKKQGKKSALFSIITLSAVGGNG